MFKLFLILLVPTFVYAKVFNDAKYIQFELPVGWECALEGSEYVCQSTNAERKREAIIILAAKQRGPQDDLPQYQAYLKQTKTYQLPGATTQRSEPKFVETKDINGQKWVDALHLASEVPGFYTRYLATVKADIGVAVTFSVTKSLYNAYKEVFDNVIKTLRVFRTAKTDLAAQLAGGNTKKGESFADGTFVPDDDVLDIKQTKVQKRGSGGSDTGGLILVVLVVGAAGFALTKLKKKKGGGKKKG